MAEQIYLLEENHDLVFQSEATDEWKKQVEELGLEGQKNLLENGGKKSPIPFQFMNVAMYNLFETICPRKIEADKYDKSPIPLKTLGVIKLCQKEGYFTDLGIWYDDVSPDPILVGRVKKGNYDYDHYLLSRWGDEIAEFSVLKDRAVKRWIESKTAHLKSKTAHLKEKLVEVQRDLDTLPFKAIRHFSGEWVHLAA